MTQETSSIFKFSNVFFILALIVFGASTAYGVFMFQIYQAQKTAISVNERTIDEKEEELKEVTNEYEAFVEEQSREQEELLQRISTILPPDEDYTELTRQLDRYFEENDTAANPIFQSSLRFGKGEPVPDMNDISMLSFSMNIEATRDNFFKFLSYVNNSGSVETGTRLMEVNSIQLNFPEGGENIKDSRQKLNFTVDMNAYYHTPKVARGS